MSIRRAHKKSRTGCVNCKKRKVKCDEHKPACLKCVRHEMECSFLVPERPSPFTSAESPDGATPRASDTQIILSPPPADPFHTALNMPQLELLYQFTTTTSSTLSSNNDIKTLWQTNVVNTGFKSEYVMLGILALSALHLAHLRPDRGQLYLAQARALHQAALSKGCLALANMTKEDGDCLFAFAMLTWFFSLVVPHVEGESLVTGNTGLPEWLVMFRGIRTITHCLARTSLSAGSLCFMFGVRAPYSQLQTSESTELDHLWKLQQIVNDNTANLKERNIYNHAIDELRQSYNLVYNQKTRQNETTDVFGWPFKVSGDFLDLLSQMKQEALTIFAYFCVLLKKIDGFWWMTSFAEHLGFQIYNLLDESHRLWITWPMKEIGVVP